VAVVPAWGDAPLPGIVILASISRPFVDLLQSAEHQDVSPSQFICRHGVSTSIMEMQLQYVY